METTACGLCGSRDSAPFLQLTDLMFERPEATSTLVRCQNCGLIYQNPRPTPAEMAEHYPEEYDCYGSDPVSADTPWLLRQVYGYGLRKRTRAVRRHLRGGRLLDVGCASGNFLIAMRQHPGWALQGVEISPYAAALAREQGLDVFTGTLEEAGHPDEHFDAVTLWDVFEHLHDPVGTLAEIRRIMKPGGVLVMRVPNADSWDAHLFGRYWAGYEPPRHTYVFGIRTLRRILQEGGFQILDLACNIGGYPTFMLSLRFWLTGRETPPARRDRLLRALGHPLMRALTAPLFFLAGLGLKGPLVIATARK